MHYLSQAAATVQQDQAQEQTSLRILLFDDDPTYRAMFEQRSSKLAICYRSCGTMQEFCDALQDFEWNAIILDYYIGDEIGMELAECISDIPVILISRKSKWTNGDLNAIKSHGGVKFVHKKFGVAKVLDIAMRWANSNLELPSERKEEGHV